jgi:hypothetical protein
MIMNSIEARRLYRRLDAIHELLLLVREHSEPRPGIPHHVATLSPNRWAQLNVASDLVAGVAEDLETSFGDEL